MAKQININSLEPGTVLMVRGKILFSRVRSQIAGPELDKVNERNRQFGRPIIERAHTKLDLKECYILAKDPQNLTLAEKFIQERLFKSTKHPEYGFCYTALNKGKFLPNICYPIPGTLEMQQYEPEEIKGELDADLDVTCYLRIYKGNPNNGLTLDTICVNEPIRFYSFDGANALASAGIIMRPSSAGREVAVPRETAASAPQAPAANTGMPIMPPVGGDPYAAAPQTYAQPPVGQPPVMNPYTTAQPAGMAPNNFAGMNPPQEAYQQPATTTAPNPQDIPFTAASQPAVGTPAPGGIRYDAAAAENPQNRNYG